MSAELTLAEAHRLSVAKWEWLARRCDDFELNPDLPPLPRGPAYQDKFLRLERVMLEELPEISGFRFHCGYCELFYDMGCGCCPLRSYDDPSSHNCCDGLYVRWFDSLSGADALKVLNYIKERAP